MSEAGSVGFAARRTHGMDVNRAAGYLIARLALPATAALLGYARAGSPWWVGPAVFDGFVALMLMVDFLRPVQFRNPHRAVIFVPYLLLFFGCLLLMGISMYGVNRSLWLVTVGTSAVLVSSMMLAMRQGTGGARAASRPPRGPGA